MRPFFYGLMGFSLLAFMVQVVICLPQFPERVASHFNGAGVADGFMSRSSFGVLMVVLNLGVPLFIFSIAQVLRFLPDSLINMPNRDYWLAEERRLDSLNYMQNLMLAIGILTLWLMMGVFHLTYMANASNSIDRATAGRLPDSVTESRDRDITRLDSENSIDSDVDRGVVDLSRATLPNANVPTLDTQWSWTLIIVYLVLVLGACGHSFWRFRKPELGNSI